MKGLVPTKMNAARRDDGDRGFGDWSRKRSPGDLAGGEALELRDVQIATITMWSWGISLAERRLS